MTISWTLSVAVVLTLAGAAHPVAATAQEGATPQVVAASPAQPGLPDVRVIGLGGTITASAIGRSLWQSYGGPRIPLAEVIERIMPELAEVANVSSMELSNVGSSALTARHMYDLTMAVDEALAREDVDGVVVTTGTNVMEEVAYWLDLTVRSDEPVVITGSMRQSNTFSYDGLANLFNSVTLAASGKTTCFGTVLLLNDEFVAAREVTKSDAVRTDTFEGGRFGALGAVDERRVRAVHAPARVLGCGTPEWRTPFDLATVSPADIADVEIVFSYMDAGDGGIPAMAAAGVQGIVTAGHGAGGISTAQAAARAAAVDDGVLFVTATRTGSGPVWGGEPGIIAAGDLMPQKARILLQLGLTFSDDPEQIRRWFETVGMPDFDLSRR